MVLFPPPFYFVFENSNLLTYIQKNTRNELARLEMGTIFLVVVLSQTKTTVCKTQSSMACTSFCSCQGSEECFNADTKQVEIERDDDDD